MWVADRTKTKVSCEVNQAQQALPVEASVKP
jgi:hypothetical protein